MRRTTHILLGAAATVPVAVVLPPAPALGCVWWGMIGGEVPDWLDLRSRAGRLVRLRHRGASHGLPVATLATVAVFVALVAASDLSLLPYRPRQAGPPALAFGLGVLSHLAGDACTVAGIQPWLPFSRRKVHLLPRWLRSRYDGHVDLLGRIAALATLMAGGIAYGLRLGW